MEAFIADLAARGVEVELADAGKLRVKGWPRATTADRERLRDNRRAIVELLSAGVQTLEPEPKKRKVKLSLSAENGTRPRAEPPTFAQPFSRLGMALLRERQRSPMCHLIEDTLAARRRQR